jgi:hypothetical protein
MELDHADDIHAGNAKSLGEWRVAWEKKSPNDFLNRSDPLTSVIPSSGTAVEQTT